MMLSIGQIYKVAAIGIDGALSVGSLIERALPQAVEGAYGVDQSGGRHRGGAKVENRDLLARSSE